jgi:hypothetical protein
MTNVFFLNHIFRYSYFLKTGRTRTLNTPATGSRKQEARKQEAGSEDYG